MFRILALDGGGIKGTYTAAVLEQFEEQLNGPIVDHFDLIVGTSTGGIIALGLACGIEASRILSLYKDQGLKIFPPARNGMMGRLEALFASKFDGKDLRELLLNYYPDRRFVDLEYRIAITSFDASSATPVVFKTGKSYHESLTALVDLSVVDVAMATSAAPTYFEGAATDIGVMIDGGVWANCPVMVGITDAMSLFKKTADEICVLSIGTTSIPTYVARDERDGGLLHWARPASSLLMHAAKLGALEMAKKLCKKLVRVDDVVTADRFPMDDARQVGDLAQLGWKAGRTAWKEVEPLFFAERPEATTPACAERKKTAKQKEPERVS